MEFTRNNNPLDTMAIGDIDYRDKEKYIAHCWDLVATWLDDIKTGKLVSNIYIKQAIDRYWKDLERDDLYFDVEKVNRVLKFFHYLKINKDNRYQQFIPLPFQIFIILNIYGFYRKETKKRRYRYAYLFTGRKSGKTTFAALLYLYEFAASGVVDPQVILLAHNRAQAGLALDYATGIIGHSKSLKSRLEPQRYRIIFRDRTKGGYCKIMASNVKGLFGLGPSAAIIDESHTMQNHDLFNMIKSGTLARDNPLVFLISTAGFSTNCLAYDLFDDGKKVLAGEKKDDLFFYLLFTLDDDDDWQDEANWIKSNPALGDTIDPEDFRLEYEQSIGTPSAMTTFLTQNLNIFTNEGEQWIPDDILRQCFTDVEWDRFKGMKCSAGIDLSSTRDLTALSLSFRDGDEVFSKTIFFRANNPQKRFRNNGIDLTNWINQGYIIECRTPTIDYDLLFRTIAALNEEFVIEKLYYDKFNSAMLIPKVQQDLGIVCEAFPQTASRFNEPLKYLEKLIYDGKWKSDKNGALLWNFRNGVLYFDGNNNIKLLKNKSLDSIDGLVALGMSIGGIIDSDRDGLDISIYS